METHSAATGSRLGLSGGFTGFHRLGGEGYPPTFYGWFSRGLATSSNKLSELCNKVKNSHTPSPFDAWPVPGRDVFRCVSLDSVSQLTPYGMLWTVGLPLYGMVWEVQLSPDDMVWTVSFIYSSHLSPTHLLDPRKR